MNSDRVRKIQPSKTRRAVSARSVVPAAARFTPQEAAVMAQPHRPTAFLISCMDSRFQPARALDYGPGVTIEHRSIACVVPPEDKAETDILGRMAFRRLNGVRNIVMVCHSDCGGIQAALQVLQPGRVIGDDLRAVASVVQSVDPCIAELGRSLLAEEDGNIRRAGDRLARDIGVMSMHNLMSYKGHEGYPTIGCEIAANQLNLTLLYYDLEHSRFEMYDHQEHKWQTAARALALFGPDGR